MKSGVQSGLAIISAIFILVVLALLGTAAVQLSTLQHIGSAQDVQSARAYHAARAGIEWGLYQVIIPNTPPNNPAGTPACPANRTLSFPATAPTLTDFKVTVECTATPGTFNGPTVIRLVATACNQPNTAGACPNTTNPTNTYIERRLEGFL